ncbi:hypothetical protein IC229_13165 [Spirosoma sp. BT702]|uniref:Uncharacterized protein n=1 Tax=Spirosoma profusum TaxID=2771354 RepID=A0A927ANC8_9BACT|nr:hypothetical protein [Spirosoma profusum]MBD2701594.1 hypothetical protein [Spirosoma profusum]
MCAYWQSNALLMIDYPEAKYTDRNSTQYFMLTTLLLKAQALWLAAFFPMIRCMTPYRVGEMSNGK